VEVLFFSRKRLMNLYLLEIDLDENCFLLNFYYSILSEARLLNKNIADSFQCPLVLQ
jgi:hypothetical protein